MIRFLAVDLFVILGSLAGVGMFCRNVIQNRRNNRSVDRVEATFIGGPLDGQKRDIIPNATYVYRHKSLLAPAAYKHTGWNIYEYTVDAVEGERFLTLANK